MQLQLCIGKAHCIGWVQQKGRHNGRIGTTEGKMQKTRESTGSRIAKGTIEGMISYKTKVLLLCSLSKQFNQEPSNSAFPLPLPTQVIDLALAIAIRATDLVPSRVPGVSDAEDACGDARACKRSGDGVRVEAGFVAGAKSAAWDLGGGGGRSRGCEGGGKGEECCEGRGEGEGGVAGQLVPHGAERQLGLMTREPSIDRGVISR